MSGRRVLALGVLLALASCKRAPARVDEAVPPDAAIAAAIADAAAVRPARCDRGAKALALEAADSGHESPEIGDAIPAFGGYAVGLVHRGPGGAPYAAVALVDLASELPPRVVDLAPTFRDAPPPRLAVKDDVVLAVALERPNHQDASPIDVRSVHKDGSATIRWQGLQLPGDSAPDLASGPSATVVVWDTERAAIRASVFGTAAAPIDARELAPETSGAELPRVVATGSGFVALWIAHRPEDEAFDAAANEVPGQVRTFGWLESQALDEHGRPGGAVRQLTSPQGHVSAYDVLALGDPGSVLVVARDDGEAVEGSGGTLLRVRVLADRIEPAVTVPTDGLGRGAPELVDARPPWLAWIGPNERLRLVPLDEKGAPAGPPSAEEAMNSARPLTGVGAGSAGPNVSFLAASPDDPAAQLREFSCAR
jgi:hypothetical protein